MTVLVYGKPEVHHEFVKNRGSLLCTVSRCGHVSHGITIFLAY